MGSTVLHKELPRDDDASELFDEQAIVLTGALVEPLKQKLQDGVGVLEEKAGHCEHIKEDCIWVCTSIMKLNLDVAPNP